MRLPEPLKRLSASRLAVEFVSSITGMREAIVVAHKNADADAVGAALGVAYILRIYGVTANLVFPEGPSRMGKLILDRFGVRRWSPDCNAYGSGTRPLLVIVDTANPIQLGECSWLLKSSTRSLAVDHHSRGTLPSIVDVLLTLPGAGSSSEIVAVLADTLSIRLPENIANALYAGILIDTRWLRNPGLWSFHALDYLLRSGASPGTVASVLRETQERDTSERIAILKAMSRLRYSRACRDILIAVTHVGSFEASVARILVDAGADVAVVAKDYREGVRISIRVSQRAVKAGIEAGILAEYIASKLGGEGGGHPGAGAVTIVTQSLTAEHVAEELARSLPGKVSRLCVGARGDGHLRGSARENGAGQECDG